MPNYGDRMPDAQSGQSDPGAQRPQQQRVRRPKSGDVIININQSAPQTVAPVVVAKKHTLRRVLIAGAVILGLGMAAHSCGSGATGPGSSPPSAVQPAPPSSAPAPPPDYSHKAPQIALVHNDPAQYDRVDGKVYVTVTVQNQGPVAENVLVGVDRGGPDGANGPAVVTGVLGECGYQDSADGGNGAATCGEVLANETRSFTVDYRVADANKLGWASLAITANAPGDKGVANDPSMPVKFAECSKGSAGCSL